VTGQQKMLTPSRHLILPVFTPRVRVRRIPDLESDIDCGLLRLPDVGIPILTADCSVTDSDLSKSICQVTTKKLQEKHF
jgi:hypothetical protein